VTAILTTDLLHRQRIASAPTSRTYREVAVVKQFKDFIMRGNVVDLAVGIIIGAAFGAVVTSLVDNLISPIIGLVGGKDFSNLTITLKDATATKEAVLLRYGQFINDVLAFVLVALAVFFFVVKPLTALNERRKRGELEPEEEPAPTDEAVLLAEIRDILKAGS
jgi:large conductance mechanosensitive channel